MIDKEIYNNKSHLLFPFFALFLLFVAVFLSVSTLNNRQDPRSRASANECSVADNDLVKTDKDKELFDLVNKYRVDNELLPLLWSEKLKNSSAWMVQDMLSNNRFSHADSLGRNVPVRYSDCGYAYIAWGENIYKGSDNPQNAFNWWKNSVEHNKNMLESNITEAAVSNKGSHWVLDLGAASSTTQSPAPTVSPVTTITINPSVTNYPSPSINISPTINLTPNPTIINTDNIRVWASVRFPGIGQFGNKSPQNLSRRITVDVYDSVNNIRASGTNFLQYDGKDLFSGLINLGELQSGVYSVKIKGDNTLLTLVVPEFQEFDSKKDNKLPIVELKPGDTDNNNVLDQDDVANFTTEILDCLITGCSGNFNVDLNDNGDIDIIDYNVFLDSFAKLAGD